MLGSSRHQHHLRPNQDPPQPLDEGPTRHTAAPPGPEESISYPTSRPTVHPACGGNSRVPGPEPPYSRGTGDDEFPHPSTSHPLLSPTGELSGLPSHRRAVHPPTPSQVQQATTPTVSHCYMACMQSSEILNAPCRQVLV